MGSVGKSSTRRRVISTSGEIEYKNGEVVEVTGDVTKGINVSDVAEMSEGHNPMSPSDWIDDMGYDEVPTAANFKSFPEYKDAYGNDGDSASASQIGKKMVTIYRAVSKDYTPSIPNGAWVTLSKAYADKHGMNALNGNYIIVKATVPADTVVWAGDSFQEWGYFPKK